MGGGPDSRCVGRVCGADGAVFFLFCHSFNRLFIGKLVGRS